ncbi:MAG TPA: PAS domain-containing protein [Candidatus Dormibacteraeota bacterium]|jgi:two-component system cell cycle sensor histidine kinase/response regulator CckA|nr:PAS domain-containing protein [Candidatus Dormibacteraeota bacterium]
MRRNSPTDPLDAAGPTLATAPANCTLASAIVPNEALYRSLIERVPGIVYISQFGPDARWHYVSPQIQEYLGYTAEEWLSNPTLWLRHVHPDDRELVLAEEQRLHKTGSAFFAEYRMVSKDGRVIWFRDESMIIRPEGSETPVLYGILFDISERKATESALRESEERLRLALEAAHLGMWEWDPETDALFWDDRHCALFGLDPRNAPATAAKYLELVYPEDREWVLHAVREALRSDDSYGAEYRVRWPDGKEHWLASAGRVLQRDSNSKARRMRGITYDVTDRRGLEEHLRRAQKMEAIGQLAGGVAHDFNNLLMVIRGHVELLLNRPGVDANVARNAEAIQKASDRAAGITQQLLAFSRKQVLQARVIEMRTVVKDIANLLRRLLGPMVEFRLQLPQEPLWVRADESQLEQVVLNLAINARDAMPQGGIVTAIIDRVPAESHIVRRRPGMPEKDYIRLRVIDTGTGMDAATQARIFEPFFTTKEFGKGTGLGLATVYGVVKQSDGWIWVDSALGEGTTFEIFLPAVDEPVGEDAKSEEKSRQAGGSETILVVDDEEGVREVATQYLSARGYRVLAAESGAQALETAKRESGQIDVLVTDALMPGMSGPALAKELLLHRPTTKVLYISGYAEDTSLLEDARDRGEAFLQKPFGLDALAEKLRVLLSK